MRWWRQIAGGIATILTIVASVKTLQGDNAAAFWTRAFAVLRAPALPFAWGVVVVWSAVACLRVVLSTAARRRDFLTAVMLLVVTTVAVGMSSPILDRLAFALVAGAGTIFAVVVLRVSALQQEAESSEVATTAERAVVDLASPLHSLVVRLGLIESALVGSLRVGVISLVIYATTVSGAYALVMQVGTSALYVPKRDRPAALIQGSKHKKRTDSAKVVAGLARGNDGGGGEGGRIGGSVPVLKCQGVFGEGDAPQAIRERAVAAGRKARSRYQACPLERLEPIAGGWLFAQPAFTPDSSRAEIVAWLDDVGRAHATFVTSDEANGYERFSGPIDWTRLGLPLDAWACASGRVVQPFTDRHGSIIAVGVAANRDVIGRADESVYVPIPLMSAWVAASINLRRPALPAGQAYQSGETWMQWYHDLAAPLEGAAFSGEPATNALLRSACR